MDQSITIVSGLPRSGTSMAMSMLAAGGVEPLIDDHRPADDSNREGYFEYEPVLSLRESSGWIPEARGKALKVIYALLDAVPPGLEYRVIFLVRDVAEVVESQNRMLRRSGREGANADPGQLVGIFTRERDRILHWIGEQPGFRLLQLDYGSVLEDPARASREIAAFLERDLDLEAMAAAVSPDLRTVG